MSPATLLTKIHSHPENVEFDEVIDTINNHYDYTPASFRNGDTVNMAGSNEGSCKIFAFASLHGLDKSQTLACFGRYYREDVLQDPGGSSHANIRSFMMHGWEGIEFDAPPLFPKS